ncbi:hypothetical protein Ancab_008239, partial [Ancistrocladus abbreviatus]
ATPVALGSVAGGNNSDWRLYMGNVGTQVDREGLREFFTMFGEIEVVFLASKGLTANGSGGRSGATLASNHSDRMMNYPMGLNQGVIGQNLNQRLIGQLLNSGMFGQNLNQGQFFLFQNPGIGIMNPVLGARETGVGTRPVAGSMLGARVELVARSMLGAVARPMARSMLGAAARLRCWGRGHGEPKGGGSKDNGGNKGRCKGRHKLYFTICRCDIKQLSPSLSRSAGSLGVCKKTTES